MRILLIDLSKFGLNIHPETNYDNNHSTSVHRSRMQQYRESAIRAEEKKRKKKFQATTRAR